MENRSRVLIISFSEISKDPRVYRQIRTVAKYHEVTVIGFGDFKMDRVRFLQVKVKGLSFLHKLIRIIGRQLSRNFDKYYWTNPMIMSALSAVPDENFDLVIANDINALPIGDRIRKEGKLIYDAHEYSPKEFENNFIWNLIQRPYMTYICKKWIKKADGMFTVCDTIADEYEKNFGVRPKVTMNVPDFIDASPSKGDRQKIRLIHHGYAFRVRKIEKMIEIMKYLDDRFTFDFMLVKTDEAYYARLKKKAKKDPRVRFLTPVPMPEIASFINAYDVGIFSVVSNNLNIKYSLPNKFFEYIQARLAVVVTPSPEMEKVIRKYDLGLIAKDYSPKAMAAQLSLLDRVKLDYYKTQANKAAHELCYKKNEIILMGVINEVLGV